MLCKRVLRWKGYFGIQGKFGVTNGEKGETEMLDLSFLAPILDPLFGLIGAVLCPINGLVFGTLDPAITLINTIAGVIGATGICL